MHTLNNRHTKGAVQINERGVSLVELLVGLVVALVVMSGAFTAYLAIANSSRANLRADRINIDVQTILDIMANDIRRAGYCNTLAFTQTCTTSNQFSIITIDASCILYTYDRDADGNKTADEFFGFRLNNGILQFRSNGDTDTDCNDGDNDWQPLSDPNLMTVQSLTLTPNIRCINGSNTANPNCAGAVTGDELTERRSISIAMTVQDANDATQRKSATTVVEVRNDRRYPAP